MPYKTWQVLKCPPQLQDPRGIGPVFEGALGEVKDDLLARQKEAAVAGYPGLGPADALPFIGADRVLPRIAGELDATYAERLRTAPTTWAEAGSIPGMLHALDREGFPFAGELYIIEETGFHHRLDAGAVVTGSLSIQRDTGRAGWSFDGQRLNTRFALLFDTDHSSLDPSTSAGAASVEGLLSLAKTWKFAGATFWGIYVILSGRLWGWPTTTTWGQASLNWGGNSVRKIRADGSYVVKGP